MRPTTHPVSLSSVYWAIKFCLYSRWKCLDKWLTQVGDQLQSNIHVCVYTVYMWSSYQSSIYPRMLPIMQPCYWNPLGLIIKAFVSLLQCTQWQQSRLEAQDTAEESHLYSAGFSFLWIFKWQDWQTYRVFYKPLKSKCIKHRVNYGVTGCHCA